MGLLLYILIFVIVAIVLGYLYIFLSSVKGNNWFNNTPSEGKFFTSKDEKIHYRIKGKGGAVVVVINSIGSSQAEWWSIQNKIGLKNRLITWDRCGYGWSTCTGQAITAKNISTELNNILKFEKIRKPVILVADYTGTLFARYFAATNPEKVAGAIFIHPFPLRYSDFLKAIHGIDECPDMFQTFKMRRLKASKGLFRFFSPLKGYNLDRQYKRYIIEHYTNTENYETMNAEASQINDMLDKIDDVDSFPKIPLKVIYPGSESLIRAWVRGGINEYSSRQLGRVYDVLSKEVLNLSPESTAIEVEGSRELIHLSKPDIIVQEINQMISKEKKNL